MAAPERALEDLQWDLAALASEVAPWTPQPSPSLRVGAVFAAAQRGLVGLGARGDPAWAAAVVMRDEHVEDASVVAGAFDAPYAAGRLALRELGILSDALRALRVAAEVVLVNATGRDHPRRAGLALHLGHDLDVPTIGVTDRVLVATGPEPDAAEASLAPLTVDGELVGYRVRTRAGARAVCVSAGWRTDPETAAKVVLAVRGMQRTPAPLREARRLARSARGPVL